MNERNQYSQRRPERRTSRRAPAGGAAALSQVPILIMVALFGLVFFLFMGLRGCAASETESTAPQPGSESTLAPSSSQESPTGTEAPVESTPEQTQAPVTTEAPVVITTTQEPTTAAPTTTEPAPQMMTVDDSYFSDALFIGDSRTDGLWLYSTPGDCKHYSGTSMTIYKVMDSDLEAYGYTGLRNLLKGIQFGKIYIMFGINECGYSTSSFAAKYREVIEEIRSYQPNAIIYIESICYVTQKHEANYPVFATENIKEKNAAIQVLANDKDIFYLEINDALNDGTDHLPSEYTGDGVHLKASCYRYWHDYLLEHAVVDEAHPWTPAADGEE